VCRLSDADVAKGALVVLTNDCLVQIVPTWKEGAWCYVKTKRRKYSEFRAVPFHFTLWYVRMMNSNSFLDLLSVV
jgi:hypothetical protein